MPEQIISGTRSSPLGSRDSTTRSLAGAFQARAGVLGRAAALPLFRPDAVSAQVDQWLGTTRAVQPWPLSIVAAGGVAVALALVAFLFFGHYTQRARVEGVLIPTSGLIKLSAPQEARILAMRVAEGQMVQKGQVLYVLDVDRRTANGDASEAAIQALQSQRQELQKELLRQAVFDRERRTSLETKLSDLGQELAQVDRQIATSAEYVAALEQELQQYQNLLDRHLTIQRDVSDRRTRLMSERSQLEQLRRDRLRLEAAQHQAEAEIGQSDSEAASKASGIRRQLADIQRSLAEAEAGRQLQVVAPEAGRVTAIVAMAGQTVGTGAPLLTVVPTDGTLQAHLYAPSGAIGFIREGASVRLRYRAYPYQKFGHHRGTVIAISRAALGPREIEAGVPLPAQNEAATFYRITVRLERSSISAYGREEPLQVGMQVDADIYLDTRPLWQWLFEPLFSLRALRG